MVTLIKQGQHIIPVTKLNGPWCQWEFYMQTNCSYMNANHYLDGTLFGMLVNIKETKLMF